MFKCVCVGGGSHGTRRVCVCVRKGARLPGGPDERERESGLAAVIFVDRFCHSNSLIHHPFIS